MTSPTSSSGPAPGTGTLAGGVARQSTLGGQLARLGFADPARAERLLAEPALAGLLDPRDDVFAGSVLSALGETSDPDLALAGLVRMMEGMRGGEQPTAGPAGPGGARTDTDRPDTARPDTARPDTDRPDTARPDTDRPDTARPDTARPDAAGRAPIRPGCGRCCGPAARPGTGCSPCSGRRPRWATTWLAIPTTGPNWSTTGTWSPDARAVRADLLRGRRCRPGRGAAGGDPARSGPADALRVAYRRRLLAIAGP